MAQPTELFQSYCRENAELTTITTVSLSRIYQFTNIHLSNKIGTQYAIFLTI